MGEKKRKVEKEGVKHTYTQDHLLANLSGLFVLLRGSLCSFSLCPFFGPFKSNQRGQKQRWQKERDRRPQESEQERGP